MLVANANIGDWDALFTYAEEAEKRVSIESGESLRQLGEEIVIEIQDHYVPVDVSQTGRERKHFAPHQIQGNRRLRRGLKKAEGGTLRESVELSEYRLSREEASITISAGGEGSGAEAYAMIQHEVTWFKHTVGQAKYIEIPVVNRCAEKLEDELSRAVGRAL
jgi:hypothetical protein